MNRSDPHNDSIPLLISFSLLLTLQNERDFPPIGTEYITAHPDIDVNSSTTLSTHTGRISLLSTSSSNKCSEHTHSPSSSIPTEMVSHVHTYTKTLRCVDFMRFVDEEHLGFSRPNVHLDCCCPPKVITLLVCSRCLGISTGYGRANLGMGPLYISPPDILDHHQTYRTTTRYNGLRQTHWTHAQISPLKCCGSNDSEEMSNSNEQGLLCGCVGSDRSGRGRHVY
ncbi:hypothetical protein BLNAU_1035 [Blattamonas nauphoetae]|uniref:Uncharacterized protein n=1 Tax=Blattamonas nauphoetae TaxID=2049346 RepID=A0ABQ9YJP3_9EUKA|nr:hypothetical protein BLNAU_1035 [Blattamonas nauphoetae]